MNLFVVGGIALSCEMPDGIDCVVLVDPGDAAAHLARWAGDVPVCIVCASASDLSDDALDAAAEVVEDADPLGLAHDRAREDDLALIAWDDSDAAYLALRGFLRRGAMAFDPLDGFRELQIAVSDIDHLVEAITRRVTRDVLRVVRSELGDTAAGRARPRARRA